MPKQNLRIDSLLLYIIIALLGYGLVALYSASTVESYKNFGNTTYYIKHQIYYGVALGLVAMAVASKIHYSFWKKNLLFILLASLTLLAMVKLSPFGFEANGAERWLRIGPLFLQPSELAKIAIIVYLAVWIEKKQNHINNFYFSLLPSIIIICLFSGLILWQPDFGTMFVMLVVAFILLFIGGIHIKYFFWSTIVAFLGLYALIHFEPYRIRRITSFLNPEIDPQGIGYQINQALIAIGAGGLFGYGYGLSRQKHSYLPEVMNDSIFAITSEELGFFRVIFILLLFWFFAKRGFKIAKAAPDTFGKILAFGITSWITVQAIINIGAMLKLLPLTGIPLPFFSYGSTAMIANLFAVGILFNISKNAKT